MIARSHVLHEIRGFTLIEVMVTVVIVAILATISLPYYSDYVRRGQVQEAFSTLSDLRVQLEQYYQDVRRYGPVGGSCGVAPASGADSNFIYNCTLSNDAQGYTLSASGKSGGLVSGLDFSVDHIGTRESRCSNCAWGFQGTQTRWIMRKP